MNSKETLESLHVFTLSCCLKNAIILSLLLRYSLFFSFCKWDCRAASMHGKKDIRRNILSFIEVALNCTGVLDIVSTLRRMHYSDQKG